jgi:ATP-dependent Clp protease protease subunit
LYSEIGPWGVTAKDFVRVLAQAGDGPITLRINSPGGDVFDGYAIYNALKARKAPVNVVIDGLAASAASFIAMAGDTIECTKPQCG